MKALFFNEFGDASVLQYGELSDPVLKPGHAIVRMHAIGLNFADIYRRRGNYHLVGAPPFILGYEGTGTVVELDENADNPGNFKLGDRVGFADAPFANAEKVAVPLDRLIHIPKNIELETAAAVLLQGLTAYYLTRDSHQLVAGEEVLIHAAAGGVGLLLVQMAKLARARVIGVTSTPEKRAAALAAGADQVALYQEDWRAQAINFSRQHKGVNVVYDSVGSTLPESFAATRTGGQVVFYGMAGGDPLPVDPRMLMDRSQTLTGGDLWNVLTDYSTRASRAQQLFQWIENGKLKVQIAKTFSLSAGAAAHAYLESRVSIGKVLMIV